jgi:hypothetical protein
MLREPPRPRFTGPALIRLLTQFGLVDAPEPTQGLADGLSQWLAWTDAIALSAALDGGAPAASAGSPTRLPAEERELARVRTLLAQAIDAELGPATVTPQRGMPPAPPAAATPPPALEFTPYRQRYLARQKAMETGIAALRSRLRNTLARSAPPLARLAAVDAVMEQALAAQERHLLSKVPALLEQHFEQLRRADEPAQALPAAELPNGQGAGAPSPSPAPAPAWLGAFHQALHQVLLAELDIRLQPVEGLLDALRSRQPATT